MRIAITLLFALALFARTNASDSLSKSRNIPVFVNGESGYACFRIPAIICTEKGLLVAIAEGRKGGCSDTGDIDLVSKRSKDGGKTWSALQVIWDDHDNTCGNPAPVLDRVTGTIHLLSTWNLGKDREPQIIDQTSTDTRRVFVMHSDDDGANWSSPVEITASVKLPEWTWYATGPGSGIQLQYGSHQGRLMVACDHIEAQTKKYFSHVIFSDDHGQTWQLGGTTPMDMVNECEVAELENGEILLNMRNYDRSQRKRQVASSKDGGLTWTDQRFQDELIEPICQGSLLVYRNKNQSVLLFSNPASTEKRENMCLKISRDSGLTWPQTIVLFPGPSAYSDLVIDKKGRVGCLFESGVQSPYEQIIYTNRKIRRD
ncbi:MAG: sialidase family protein [Bacteroidia bacterium]